MDRIIIPDPIRIGRRALEDLPNVKLIKDLYWKGDTGILLLEIFISDLKSKYINKKTQWYILIDKDYPLGRILIYPSIINGLEYTFQHQYFNSSQSNFPWRTGNICTDPVRSNFGNSAWNIEEPSDSNNRLKWHIGKIIEWIKAAAEGRLVEDGDIFELPDWNLINKNKFTLITNETNNVNYFSGKNNCSGLVKFKCKPEYCYFDKLCEMPRFILFTSKFQKWDGTLIKSIKWGKRIDSLNDKIIGIWLKLNKVPVLEPWQTPATWDSLIRCIQAQGVDISAIVNFTRHIVQEENHLLIMGFPIPKTIGGENCRLSWQAVMLPKIQEALSDRYNILLGLAKLKKLNMVKAIRTENWASEEITSRVEYSKDMVEKKYLLLGAGALGSFISEMMVRSGTSDILIMDDDIIEIGNLCRHTLDMDNLKRNKALSLSQHLNNVNPHANISYIDEKFPSAKDKDKILERNVVIDCTAQDKTLLDISRYDWQKDTVVFLFSLNIYAKRLYAFYSGISPSLQAEYSKKMVDWNEKDKEEMKGVVEFPREGIGCWHPLFPGSIENICMMASFAIKFIIEMINNHPSSSILSVYEQQAENGKSTGINRMDY